MTEARAEGMVVRARVRLAADGSPPAATSGMTTGQRIPWDIGNRHDSSWAVNDAVVTVEDGRSLEAGAVAVVRLRPVVPAFWRHVTPGMTIHAHDAQDPERRIASAEVLAVGPAEA